MEAQDRPADVAVSVRDHDAHLLMASPRLCAGEDNLLNKRGSIRAQYRQSMVTQSGAGCVTRLNKISDNTLVVLLHAGPQHFHMRSDVSTGIG